MGMIYTTKEITEICKISDTKLSKLTKGVIQRNYKKGVQYEYAPILEINEDFVQTKDRQILYYSSAIDKINEYLKGKKK